MTGSPPKWKLPGQFNSHVKQYQGHWILSLTVAVLCCLLVVTPIGSSWQIIGKKWTRKSFMNFVFPNILVTVTAIWADLLKGLINFIKRGEEAESWLASSSNLLKKEKDILQFCSPAQRLFPHPFSFSSGRLYSISKRQQTFVTSCYCPSATICVQIQKQHRAEMCVLFLSTDARLQTDRYSRQVQKVQPSLMCSVRLQRCEARQVRDL